LFLTAAAVWFFRLLSEAIPGNGHWYETLWLVFARPLILAGIGIYWASLFIKSYKLNSRRRFWLWAFFAAAVFCIPYAPDMHASFVKAGEKRAWLLSFAFYSLGILTYGLIRGGACAFWMERRLKSVQNRFVQSAVLYVFFLVIEFFFFHTWHPITYFPALPLPVPSSGFTSVGVQKNVRYVLLETHMEGETRRKIEQGGSLALSILGSKLAEEVKSQLKNVSLAKDVVVILPETFIAVSEVNDVRAAMIPTIQTLFNSQSIESVVWIQGAFVANNNVVLGSEFHRSNLSANSLSNNYKPIWILRKKNEEMPMFEAPSKGVSYSTKTNDGSLTEQVVPESAARLREFVDSHRILICYESLFPSNWRLGRASVVLTNHHLFNEFKLMNWVYFGFLRQLSFVFNSSTKVVSNYNPSGLLQPAYASSPSEKGGDEGWTVVKIK